MNIISFSDGTRMTLAEYRSMCLKDAAALADHGAVVFRTGQLFSLTLSVMSVTHSMGSLNLAFSDPHWCHMALWWSALLALGCAIYFRMEGSRNQQSCFLRRQSIMDGLSRIEKAFAELE